jgi:heptosyltransferase IV
MKVTPKIFDLNKMNSVLFVRLGKLGDMMTASYAIKSVRRAFPRIKIGLLTLPRSRELFRYCDEIDMLKLWAPVSLPFLAVSERFRSWDLLVDLTDEPSRRSVLALKLIKPKHSIAFDNIKTKPCFEKTIPTPDREKTHMLERMAAMAAALGGIRRDLRPVVYLKPGLKEKLRLEQEQITGKKGAVITLNISAGHKSRYWQQEKWEALAAALLKKYGKAWIRILHSPADEKEAAALIKKINSPRVLRYDGKSLHDFLAHIAASDMLVSPDTSAVHAACARGVPVTGLYPEPYWNFVSWKPSGRNTMAIRSPKDGVENIAFEQVRGPVLKMAARCMR